MSLPTPASSPAVDSAAEPSVDPRLERLESRLVREREARKEAERLLETKSSELYDANLALQALTHELEARVAERTAEVQRLMEAERTREDQLRHAQKMEALGLLAGGVAHDFNNLLTVIGGASQLLQSEAALTPYRDLLDEITGASTRAGALTSQLLAFSRRRTTKPQRFVAAIAIQGVQLLLRRLLTERVELRLDLADDARTLDLYMDRSGFDQILLNLAANARDAVPDSGWCLVRLAATTVDDADARTRDVAPGHFLRLEVADSGVGMDAETVQRAFDPFFTTKALGEGSGLGLANVYAIVRQAGGHIEIASTSESGTTIRMHLPVAPMDAPRETASATPRPSMITSSTILIVDDEPGVRAVTALTLKKRGFQVIQAPNGEEALEMLRHTESPVDALLSDVRMPGMNGFELAMAIREQHPTIALVLMSGYVDEEHLRDRITAAGIPLIEKPFTSDILVDTITRTLHSGAS